LIVVMHKWSKTQTRTFVHVTAGHRAYSTCGKRLNLTSTKVINQHGFILGKIFNAQSC